MRKGNIDYCKSPNYPRPNRPGTKDNSNLDNIVGGSQMVLDNRTYIEDNNCDKCENSSICKWCNSMKSIREYVANDTTDKCLSPIKIRITCDSFKKKSERQDGWYKTGQRDY